MDIQLNKVTYTTKGGISFQKAPPFARAIRQTGQHLRSDIQPLPQWSPDNLTGGLLRKWYRTDKNQYWFGTALTLWPNQITLPLKVNTATHTSDPTIQYDAFVLFRGSLYGIGVTAGGALDISKWTGTTWAAPVVIAASGAAKVAGAVVSDDTIIVLYVGAADALSKATSTDAVTWATAAVSGTWPARIVHDDITGNDYYAAITSVTGKEVNLYKSTNNGSAWTLINNTADNVHSSYGVTGLAMFPHSGGTVIPMIATAEGVFAAVSAPSNTELREVMNFHGIASSNNGQGMGVWQSLLVVPALNGQVWTLNTDDVAATIGLDSGDGLPTDYKGNITALLPSRNLLIAAVNATKSGVYAFDGLGWHPLWIGTSSITINALHDIGTTTPALVFTPSAGTYYYMQHFYSNPLELGATFESEGYIEYPIFGGTLPELKGGFVKLAVYAHQLTNSESIILSTSLDGGAYQDVVQIKENGVSVLLDMSGYDLQLKATLYRGSATTNTPVLHYPILTVNKTGIGLWNISFDVDVVLTAKRTQTTPEKVMAWVMSLASNPGHIQLVANHVAYNVVLTNISIKENVSTGQYVVRVLVEQVP